MEENNKQLTVIWRGITIDIFYVPDYSKAFREIYGHPLAHLEVRAEGQKRLPFTETGYRSHFSPASSIEGHGGPEKFVLGWLDFEAQSKKWKDYVDSTRQLTLF